ncbi:MAG: PAS domain S-box protein [Gemmatimonadota bacterium]
MDPLRILIIEDVAMDAELVEYELARASIPCTTLLVDSREAFLQGLEAFRPDVILSDYSVPSFDGMAALSLARERAPDIPFVIVTGSVNEETAVGCMKAGATDYLLKSNLARIGPAIDGAIARTRLRLEQSAAEAALRRSEDNLRAIFDHSLDAFVLVNRDGAIQAMNPTAIAWGQRVFKHIVGEGQHFRDFIPATVAGFDDALSGNAQNQEQCIPDLDGRERWFELKYAPVVDSMGHVIGACLNARDVSERKRSEQALRESEMRYRDLFDNASDLMCLTASDGRFLYVNEAWHATMGYSDADLQELNLIDVIHPESRTYWTQVGARVVAGEALNHVELDLMTRHGLAIKVEGNLTVSREDGRPATIRGIYRDVTERKRVEEHLRRAERMQAAGRLAGGVAHEVNNMMTAVLGFAEFVRNSMAPEDPRRADVHEIIKAGTRAADVTRQLLAFTRQQVLRPEVLPINAVVQRMERMLRRTLGAEHELRFNLSDEAGEIRADGAQLEQVLINLLLNARDAMTEPGCVTIATSLATLDEVYAQRHDGVAIEPGQYALLAFTDTGCGMEAAVRERIFEPFFTTKLIGQGTGLGLSTVYGIVKQSGGFVWVYSEVGHGTTFKIYLPCAQSAEPIIPEPVTGALPERGSETILLVEDEDVVRTLAARGLRAHGYTVIEVASALAGLRCVEAGIPPVDVVISDVVMPEMGGREFGRRLTVLRPNLPVLYTSGYAGDDVIQRGLLDPGAPFQQKPFTPDGLARKVRELLDQRRHLGVTNGAGPLG